MVSLVVSSVSLDCSLVIILEDCNLSVLELSRSVCVGLKCYQDAFVAHHVGYCFHICSCFPHSCSECVPEHMIVYVGELIPYALHLRIYCFADLCELVVQFLVVPAKWITEQQATSLYAQRQKLLVRGVPETLFMPSAFAGVYSIVKVR